MNDFLSLARDRYSCREFTDQPVEAQKIDALLEAARLAPTAVNKQPWHAWVITDPEALAKLNATTRFGFGAKVVIVLGAARDEAWTRKYDGANFADVDASIVGTHIMLAAHDMGLGTTWVACFDAPALQEAFPQMSGYDLVGLFPLGYPSPDYAPAAGHLASKKIDELVDRI